LHIVANLIQKYEVFKNTLVYQEQIGARSKANKKTQSLFKQFFLSHNAVYYHFFKLDLTSRYLKKRVDGRFSSSFLFLSPKLIITHVIFLLEKNARSKIVFSAANLSIGISFIIRQLLLYFKQTLLGVKVICSGR
jgi:hypothetical protein